MNQLELIPPDGTTRPPGARADITPRPGLLIQCPKCHHKRLDYMSRTYAACERRQCGYEWRRSAQLHHTEPIPF